MPLRLRPGIGALCNVVLIGLVIHAVLAVAFLGRLTLPTLTAPADAPE